MDAKQFAEISKDRHPQRFYFEPQEWTDNPKDRTLLYGYDCDRNTWHVYLYGGQVFIRKFTPIHEANRISERINLAEEGIEEGRLQSELIPNKRLYPERCDFDFCQYLKDTLNLSLPFTNFDESRAVLNDSGFYGDM